MLKELLPGEAFAYFLVFARVGSAMVVLPGIGEAYISPRFRLLLALVVTVVMEPVLAPHLPDLPAQPAALLLLVGGEILVGLFLGTIARVLISALVTAGTVISFLTGFANALLFNPMLADQGALLAIFLSLLGLLMVLVTDTHHVMLLAIADSYTLFKPGMAPPFGDFADMMSRVVADSFRLGIQIAAPFMVVAVIFFTGLGLLARMMPQMPVFFVGMPLQIMLGLAILLLTITAIMGWFLGNFEHTMGRFLAPG